MSQQPDSGVPEEGHGFDYDLIVIGGGSGGLACVKEAARYGKKCAVFDYVVPSPKGTKWGLGGTCVNVGCIPKKLFHRAALLRESQRDMPFYGWQLQEPVPHDWSTLVANVNDYIKSLNWSYQSELRTAKVDYFNEFAVFVDRHTVEATDKDGKKRNVTARRFVIAVGGRPRYTGIANERELCISSDDVFQLERPPGRTLVIGASYIAVECGGFLRDLGFDVTMMVRSKILREFDQDMAARVAERVAATGIQFLQPAVPTAYDREPDGRIRVTYTENGVEGKTDIFDTVLLAIGRAPVTPALQLDRVGVILAPSGKIPVISEQTNVPNIYALGDCIEGRLELTPVAIQAGVLLARRLYAGSVMQMDYDNVPTTVFSPLEYGSVGLSEEEAIKRYGAEALEVFHVQFQPLEFKLNYERYEEKCYAKLICIKAENMRVIGLHILGPEAGEITQGFAIGLKLGATKFDFDNLVGIHPTAAEQFTTMTVTKASGEDPDAGGC